MNWKHIAWASIVVAVASLGWNAAGWSAARNQLNPQDYVDIQELYATYARGYDTDEADGRTFAETFVADGSLTLRDRTISGSKDLAAYAHQRDKSGGTVQHWNANLLIRPVRGGAVASTYLMVLRKPSDGSAPRIDVVSQYNDTLVKTAEGWRFKNRTPGQPILPVAQHAP